MIKWLPKKQRDIQMKRSWRIIILLAGWQVSHISWFFTWQCWVVEYGLSKISLWVIEWAAVGPIFLSLRVASLPKGNFSIVYFFPKQLCVVSSQSTVLLVFWVGNWTQVSCVIGRNVNHPLPPQSCFEHKFSLQGRNETWWDLQDWNAVSSPITCLERDEWTKREVECYSTSKIILSAGITYGSEANI